MVNKPGQSTDFVRKHFQKFVRKFRNFGEMEK